MPGKIARLDILTLYMPGADRRGQEHQSGDLDASEHQSGILVAKKGHGSKLSKKMILHM